MGGRGQERAARSILSTISHKSLGNSSYLERPGATVKGRWDVPADRQYTSEEDFEEDGGTLGFRRASKPALCE